MTKDPVAASGPCPGWWVADENGKLDYKGYYIPEYVQTCDHHQIEIIDIKQN
jgi:hypothetical protein